ncbi:hypothetical protein C8A05DRAFT_18131 [Staphylotrichum tortipilum]|uniref:Uncharacterized protein n=1 Tax=Staphylotrichum tortipilum TaxID=2831512 RepID=A0AAN6MEJ1_9PEZI|nr:hypothetical protein C8A05DRAFT_18131 [Staphylotrichum longicolle]
MPSAARIASNGGGNHRLAPSPTIVPGQGKSAANATRSRPQPPRPDPTIASRRALEEALDALIKSTAEAKARGVVFGSAASAGPAGAGAQRQPSLPARLQGPPQGGRVAGPMAPQGAGGPSAPPGGSTLAFFNALQAIKPDPEEEGLHPRQQLHRELACKMQSRIWGLRQGLYAQKTVPHDFLCSFDFDVHELVKTMGRMGEAVDELSTQLKRASSGGDQGRVRALESDVAEARERAQNAERVLAGLAGRADEDLRAIQFLKEQLRQNEMARTILQEQVNGKRSLWMNVHNDPNERPSTRESQGRVLTPLSGQTFAPPPNRRAHQSIPSISQRSTPSQTTGNQQAASRSVSETITGAHVSTDPLAQAHFVPRPVHASASFRPGAPYPGGPYPGAPHHGGGPSGNHAPFPMTAQQSAAAAAHLAHYQHMRQPSNAAPGATHSAMTIAETGSPKEKERKRNANANAKAVAVATTASGVPRTLLRTDGAGDDAECLKWAEDFQTLFAHVYGFCRSYFYELPRIGHGGDWKAHITAEANAQVWELMCRAAWGVGENYPGEHAVRLLNDRESRPYLLQRLVLQYVMSFVFGEGGWKEYVDQVGGEVAKVDQRLQVLDPSRSVERQALLDRRTTLLTSLASGTESGPFKNFKLTQHHQYLKTLVAPFLPKRIPKPTGPPASNTNPAKPPSATSLSNEAFYDLFTITAAAWDLSTRMHTLMPPSPSRRLSLQYSWAEHGARFAADSHEPVDCGVDRRTLQQEHIRVTLCTTPAVTVRVVRGEGTGGNGKVDVDVRNILKAGVLVMRY